MNIELSMAAFWLAVWFGLLLTLVIGGIWLRVDPDQTEPEELKQRDDESTDF